MPIPETQYTILRHTESGRDGGDFGVKILATVKRPLSREENLALYEAEELITEAILKEDLRLDPSAQHQKNQATEVMLSLFIKGAHFRELPNGYCSRSCCSQKPWYKVLTEIGWLTIGWRKRVMNIDWTETVVELSGEELFPVWDSTRSRKGDPTRFLHVGSYEDAQKVIDQLYISAPRNQLQSIT